MGSKSWCLLKPFFFKDIPNHTPADGDYIFFDSPWLALVKTSTMFVGEIEFSDIPINMDAGSLTVNTQITESSSTEGSFTQCLGLEF